MINREGSFTGARSLSIHYRYWEPEVPVKAVILLVHGAGEHGGRYEQFADYFTGNGYAVAALDHPNHGRSGGRYGHVERFEDFLESLGLFHRQVAADLQGLPLFLLGHSMGGLISSHYLLAHQEAFAGCVLSGPAIKAEIEPPPPQMWLIRILSAVLPRVGVMQLDPDGISRDPVVVEEYVRDPLVNHGRMTARMVAELFAFMHRIQSRAGEITLPLLVLHGAADPMTSPSGSRFFYERVGSVDKTLKIYPGLYHEIFNEPEQAEVLADVLAWFEKHLPAAP